MSEVYPSFEDIISNYTPYVNCPFCGEPVDTPYYGYQTCTNIKCLKHTFYSYRLCFKEEDIIIEYEEETGEPIITQPNINKGIIIATIATNQSRYTPENNVEGKFIYNIYEVAQNI